MFSKSITWFAPALAVMLLVPITATAQQRGKFNRVNTVYDQIQNGQKGMIIQLDMEIDGLQNQEVGVAAFFTFKNGDKLSARPGRFAAPDNQVTTQVKVRPGFPATDYKNYELFIPYDELSLNIRGVYELRYHVEIQTQSGGRWQTLAFSPFQYFTLTQD